MCVDAPCASIEIPRFEKLATANDLSWNRNFVRLQQPSLGGKPFSKRRKIRSVISSLRLSAPTNFPLSLIEFHSIRFPIGNLPVFTYYFLCLPREFVAGRYSFRYRVTASTFTARFSIPRESKRSCGLAERFRFNTGCTASPKQEIGERPYPCLAQRLTRVRLIV